MLWPVLISGFTLGAAGSLHCVGMCGPLSLALPVHHLSGFHKFISLLLYQLGRIITYSIIGLLFGLAGRRIYISGYQQWFSIGMGILVLILAALYFIRNRAIHLSFLNRFYLLVQGIMVKLLKSSTNSFGFLLMGMANGLLPCGMVYIAIASTLSFSGVRDGSKCFLLQDFIIGGGTAIIIAAADYSHATGCGNQYFRKIFHQLRGFEQV